MFLSNVLRILLLNSVICLLDLYDLRARWTSISDLPKTRSKSLHPLTPR